MERAWEVEWEGGGSGGGVMEGETAREEWGGWDVGSRECFIRQRLVRVRVRVQVQRHRRAHGEKTVGR